MTPIAPVVFSTTDPKTIGQKDESASQTWAANSFVYGVSAAGVVTYTVCPSSQTVALGIAGLAPQAAYGSANTPRPPTQLWGKTHNPISPRNAIFAINICAGSTLTTTIATANLLPGATYGIILQSNGATVPTTVHMLNTSDTTNKVLEFIGIHPDANVLGTAEPGTRVLVRVVEAAISS